MFFFFFLLSNGTRFSGETCTLKPLSRTHWLAFQNFLKCPCCCCYPNCRITIFCYDLVSFLAKNSPLLSDRREGWGHIEIMNHDTWINPWYIPMAPSEDVLIILQENSELLADWRIHLHIDTGDPILEVVIQGDLLQVFHYFYHDSLVLNV